MSQNSGSTLKKMFIFFALFGLPFLGIGLYFLNDAYQFTHDPAVTKTTGTVVELASRRSSSSNSGSYTTTYAPVISFTKTDGSTHTFESSNSSNPPSYSVGESVNMLYRGSEYKIDSFADMYLFSIIFSSVGLVFAAVGVGGLFVQARRRKKIEQLKNSGTQIKAKVTEIFQNTSLKVNGRSPWKIIVKTSDTALGQSIFTSDNIWFDPSESAPLGKEVTVYVNMSNPEEYYVDVSFLPTVI